MGVHKNTSNGILKYMQEHKEGITVTECLKLFHTTELRKYVSKIRASGIEVLDEWVQYKDQYGITHRFKRYFVKEEIVNA